MFCKCRCRVIWGRGLSALSHFSRLGVAQCRHGLSGLSCFLPEPSPPSPCLHTCCVRIKGDGYEQNRVLLSQATATLRCSVCHVVHLLKVSLEGYACLLTRGWRRWAIGGSYHILTCCCAILTCTSRPGVRSFRTCASALIAARNRACARSCRCSIQAARWG